MARPTRKQLDKALRQRHTKPVGERSMARPTRKQLDKAFARLDAAFLAHLQTLGLREKDPESKASYLHVLNTPAGLLLVSIYDGAVFTRFEDLEQGTRFTATMGKHCNPHTGKWNFHYSTKTLESLQPENCVPDLAYWFEKLLEWDGKVDSRIKVPAVDQAVRAIEASSK